MRRVVSIVVLTAVMSCGEPPVTTSNAPIDVAAATADGGLAPMPLNDAATQAELEALLSRWSAMDIPSDPPPSPPPQSGVWTLTRGGRVLAEGPMRRGLREGLWRRYDESGQRIEEGRYHADLPVGRWHRWRSDGVAMDDVVYGAGACSTPPERIERPMSCGSHRLGPLDPAPLESFGIGETRRCAGRAAPWLVAGLRTPSHSPWRDLLTISRSPELQQVVWAQVLADLSSHEGEGFHLLAGQMASGAPEERAWIAELALAHPEALTTPAHFAILDRAGTAPGFAARWYLEARRRERLHEPPRMLGTLLPIIQAMVEVEPALALPLTADASTFLGGELNTEGHLSVIRADRYLDLAQPALAGVEIERALRAFRLGHHARPEAMVAELQSRWRAGSM